MKTKKFTPPAIIKFLFLFLIVVTLLVGVKAEAMPEASTMFACYYPALAYDKLLFSAMFTQAYCEWYDDVARERIKHELGLSHNQTVFKQEQAEKEIAAMIDAKKLPNYILDKGKYNHDTDVNAVYFIEELKLRSQPNFEARVISEIFAWDPEEEHSKMPVDTYSYLGEWTSPNGESWVIINYTFPEEDENGVKPQEIGFVPKKDARFVTNAQVKQVADVVEFLEVAADFALTQKREREELEEQNIELRQMLANSQRPTQQAEQVYQCQKCDLRATVQSANNLPSGPCYNDKGKWSILGTHRWNRLQ